MYSVHVFPARKQQKPSFKPMKERTNPSCSTNREISFRLFLCAERTYLFVFSSVV